MTDVMGGQIELQFDQMATSLPQVRAGRVRALAVTSSKRAAALPEIPTISESGVPAFETTAWFGLLGPARMPPALVMQINAAVHKVLADREVDKKLTDQGLELTPDSPEHFAATLKAEKERWSTVLTQAGINPE